MSNLDMSEAIRLLAQEKSLSEDALLHVLVDALASAYKRRPGAADERTATIRVEAAGEAVDHTVDIDSIDRARTVFVWGPQPKPGKAGSRKAAAPAKGIRQSVEEPT